jgi:ATP-dependent protease Clp ATPase subunit
MAKYDDNKIVRCSSAQTQDQVNRLSPDRRVLYSATSESPFARASSATNSYDENRQIGESGDAVEAPSEASEIRAVLDDYVIGRIGQLSLSVAVYIIISDFLRRCSETELQSNILCRTQGSATFFSQTLPNPSGSLAIAGRHGAD